MEAGSDHSFVGSLVNKHVDLFQFRSHNCQVHNFSIT